jgi:hypothetical protein
MLVFSQCVVGERFASLFSQDVPLEAEKEPQPVNVRRSTQAQRHLYRALPSGAPGRLATRANAIHEACVKSHTGQPGIARPIKPRVFVSK